MTPAFVHFRCGGRVLSSRSGRCRRPDRVAQLAKLQSNSGWPKLRSIMRSGTLELAGSRRSDGGSVWADSTRAPRLLQGR